MILKCSKCGNEEVLEISNGDCRRKYCYTANTFKIKISRYHDLHIDCLKCGCKINIFA